MSNEDTCPTCAEQYCGRYCIDCGRDTRLPPELSEMQRLDDDDMEELTHRHKLQAEHEQIVIKAMQDALSPPRKDPAADFRALLDDPSETDDDVLGPAPWDKKSKRYRGGRFT